MDITNYIIELQNYDQKFIQESFWLKTRSGEEKELFYPIKARLDELIKKGKEILKNKESDSFASFCTKDKIYNYLKNEMRFPICQEHDVENSMCFSQLQMSDLDTENILQIGQVLIDKYNEQIFTFRNSEHEQMEWKLSELTSNKTISNDLIEKHNLTDYLYHRKEQLRHLNQSLIGDINKIRILKRSDFRSDKSYLNFLESEIYRHLDTTDFFSWSFPVVISEKDRKRHVFILGGTGSGKSELTKLFIYYDIPRPCGVILIEPHSDLSKQITHLEYFQKHPDELVYISPEFADTRGLLPQYNPLEYTFTEKSDFALISAVARRVEKLIEAFETIFQDEFTHNMHHLLFNCLRVLIDSKRACISDLLDFLHPSTNEEWIMTGTKHYDKNVRRYFESTFSEKRLDITKMAVLTRFENALGNQCLKRMLDTQKSSFDITQLLEQGKVVIINASKNKFGSDGTRILGSFLMSELITHAFKREDIPENKRRPFHIYIDECQNYLNPNIDVILSETRKYGLHLTTANQYLGQFSGQKLGKLKESIMANTQVKFASPVSVNDTQIMSKEIGMDISKAGSLQEGRFALKPGKNKPIVIQASGDLIMKENNSNYMTDDEYEKLIEYQLAKYYRPIDDIPQKSADDEFSSDTGNIDIVEEPQIDNIL